MYNDDQQNPHKPGGLPPDSTTHSSEIDREAEKPLDPEAELRLIIARCASEADPADLARVRELLNENPHLWRLVCDPARRAAALFIERSPLKPLEREGVIAGFSDLLRSLDYDRAHPVVRLMIDQVALRWLYVAALDHAYAQTTTLSPKERTDWERRINSANRRLNQACQSLTQIQRLLQPTRR